MTHHPTDAEQVELNRLPVHVAQVIGLVRAGASEREARAHVCIGLRNQMDDAKANNDRPLIAWLNQQITNAAHWPIEQYKTTT